MAHQTRKRLFDSDDQDEDGDEKEEDEYKYDDDATVVQVVPLLDPSHDASSSPPHDIIVSPRDSGPGSTPMDMLVDIPSSPPDSPSPPPPQPPHQPPSLPSTLREPSGLVESGIIFDVSHALYDVRVTVAAPQPPPQATPVSSQSSSSTTGKPPTDHDLRPLTQDAFQTAKPHPDALFCPATMQWVYVAQAGQELGDDDDSAVNESDSSLLPIFDSSQPFHLAQTKDWPAGVPTIQVASFEEEQDRTATRFPGPFTLHTVQPNIQGGLYPSSKSHRAYLTAVVPSSLPRHLLPSLRKTRRDNPAPGQSADESVTTAFKTLLRILANASRNDVRHLPLNSGTLVNKLGVDDVTLDILRRSGFTTTTMDDGRNAVKAAAQDPDLTLRNLIEVLAWWEHNERYNPHKHRLELEAIGFTAEVPRVESTAHLARHWLSGWDTQPFETADYQSSEPSTALREALTILGVGERSTDAVVERLYLANMRRLEPPITIALQDAATVLFSALDTVHSRQRPQSEALQTLCAIERSRERYTVQDLRDAYSIIGCNPDGASDIDVIAEYWDASAKATRDGNFQHAKTCKDALGVIKTSRLHPPELQQAYDAPLEMSPAEAYEALQIPAEDPQAVEDSMIMTLFDMHVADDPSKRDHLREALGAIAKHRRSDLLTRFHQTGEKDDEGLGKTTLPAGLNNIGNTCYLNSVLQYFFALKPLREAVLSAAFSLPKDRAHIARRVGGRKVTAHEMHRSVFFVRHLARLFDAMITSPALAVTPERELAYMALVSSRAEGQAEGVDEVAGALTEEPAQIAGDKAQAGTGSDSPVDADVNMEGTDAAPSQAEDSAPAVDDAALATPPLSAAPPLPPRPPMPSEAVNERRNSLMSLGAQQDVSECLDNVLFQIEVALGGEESGDEGTEGSDSGEKDGNEAPPNNTDANGKVFKLFTGKTCQVVAPISGTPSAQTTTHTKNEIFTILPIDVFEEAGRDIYDGLDGFFEEEILPGGRVDNADGSTSSSPYSSSSPSVKRSVTLLEPPPVLQIQLQRVQFDRVRGAYKSQAHLEMTDELYMDRYLDFSQLDASDEEIARLTSKREDSLSLRRTIGGVRSRLRELQPQFGKSAQEKLKKTSEVLQALRGVKDLAGIEEDLRAEARKNADPFWDDVPAKGGEDDDADLIDLSSGEATPTATKCLDLATRIPASLPQFLLAESRAVAAEIRELEAQLRDLKAASESIWKDEQRCRYKLISIFMHRGEASHGHYFLEQRRLGEEGEPGDDGQAWFKYNDSVVEEVPLRDVLKDKTGATPYLLCYVRDDLLSDAHIFESLMRHIA